MQTIRAQIIWGSRTNAIVIILKLSSLIIHFIHFKHKITVKKKITGTVVVALPP